MIFLIVYLIIGLVVGSFAFIDMLRKEKERFKNLPIYGAEIALFTFCSIFYGLVWVLTIWIALLTWFANRDKGTPDWVKDVKDLFDLFKKVIGKKND